MEWKFGSGVSDLIKDSQNTHMLLMQEKELPMKTQDAPPQHSDLMGAAARLALYTHVWPSVRHEEGAAAS